MDKLEKIEQIMQKIGLTTQESRVYLGLVELQEAQTGKLCKYVNIASSNIYQLLAELIEKGLVHYRVQNNVKVFMPSLPEVLNELFLERQRELDAAREQVADLVVSLKRREPERIPYSDYKYFEGITGIKALWHQVVEEMGKDTVVRIYCGNNESYVRLLGFYDSFHQLRVKKGTRAKIMLPYTDKELGTKREKESAKVRYHKPLATGEWGVIDDLVYLQHLSGKTPRGFLISDPVFAKLFKEVFEKSWASAHE